MARYLQTAAEANKVAQALLSLVSENDRPMAAEMIARLVNFGIRCAPRAVQSTVRLNAVREAVKGMPVRVSMEQRRDERSGKTYNALTTQQIGGNGGNVAPVVEGAGDED